jgi:hypothetical protein
VADTTRITRVRNPDRNSRRPGATAGTGWLTSEPAIRSRAGLIRNDDRAGTVFRHDHGTRHPHNLEDRACFTSTTPNYPPRDQPVITPLCRDRGRGELAAVK